ncbi:hypothetical protein HBI56_150320 [Parastagonospora nodorum]|nr:hypothetical protein HBH53_151580 [Parastagonospora nodorum]KAH3995273.1 hypothetical protein HBI10_173920 [Parastagonospora nodorum]KAH4016067.1 hypothetical protein HBI13_152840 [Parastagonospora nodorum]KAH4017398.1 hypothetical protein HBI09_196790 [Parastagonospora nodorum]KAH4161374.1 hypothetical protein HBH43_171590 [Parastagonospora nodorum]
MVPASISLVNLPLELIYDISDFLPPDAVLALKLTHRNFNSILPLDSKLNKTPLSDCARLATRTYLSKPSPEPSHLRCILCKTVYPVNLFKSSSSPACIPTSFTEDVQQTDVVELPQRLCSWHVSRLVQVVHTGPGGRNQWTSHMEDMCMHCGAIQAWTKCDCRCDSCPIRPVRTYTRYLNNPIECRRFLFWKDRMRLDGQNVQDGVHGQLMVRETCWNPRIPTQNTVINVPVRFEGCSQPVMKDHIICSAMSRPQNVVGALLGPPRHL